jgi:hypothetical protein
VQLRRLLPVRGIKQEQIVAGKVVIRQELHRKATFQALAQSVLRFCKPWFLMAHFPGFNAACCPRIFPLVTHCLPPICAQRIYSFPQHRHERAAGVAVEQSHF